ncbi:autotransporter domain-containing protein [Variovorax sp. KK3]|uniref:autotransporter domain-containing protein n=1 Tax=Variovorax sp. KK3 TaxID=1855728 RepID=UPI0011800F4E|nr:autotransporter domain-containing protein [Variovorax sp. KK3]
MNTFYRVVFHFTALSLVTGNAIADGGAGGSSYLDVARGGAGGTAAAPSGSDGADVNAIIFRGRSGGGGGAYSASGDGAPGGMGAGDQGGAGGRGGALGLLLPSNAVLSAYDVGVVSGGAGGTGAAGVGALNMGSGGGGGGGGGAAMQIEADAGRRVLNGDLAGGSGGMGGRGTEMAGGGGGGQGGAGLLGQGTGLVIRRGTSIRGGFGGNGGIGGTSGALAGAGGSSGAGGDGGAGVVWTGGPGSLQNDGLISGALGAGGPGSVNASGGNGGRGGVGLVWSAAGGTFVNTSIVGGGNGGIAGPGAGPAWAAIDGSGGAGVSASNLELVNFGTIIGGVGKGGAGARAEAIVFTGGTNKLELHPSSGIVGEVVAVAGGSDQLILSGTGNGTLEVAQYRNFASFTKRGAGSWTLAGSTTALTPWTITEGTLSIGDDRSLGSTAGALTIDGGRLRTTADVASMRPVGIGTLGASLLVDTGTTFTVGGVVSGGRLVKEGDGALVLTGDSSHTGGTRIAAGVLSLGNGGSGGSIVGDVVNGALLRFNRSDAATFGGVVSGSGAVEQRGTGTTTLVNANTYTGGTTIAAGTLQLGDGGSRGSIAGDVTNHGILAFNRADRSDFAGVISGGGAVEQRGTGTTTLTRTQAYSGGTVVAGGTLQLGAGGTDGWITGDVANRGTLAFNRSDATTFDGAISGDGSVEQRGAGTTTLTGANRYVGNTTVHAGTLRAGGPAAFAQGGAYTVHAGTLDLAGFDLEASGLSGAGGRITLGGARLTVNQGIDTTYAGAVGGAGGVTKSGTGTLALTGINTYEGGTAIERGVLTGHARSFGSGAITNHAALVVDQPADAAFANAMSGSGSFTKTGDGSLDMTGDGSAFTGTSRVAAGTLAVNGGLGGTLSVAAGATLQGNGTVGSAVVERGGIVAPGNSIGTLHVAGDLTLAPGATYRVEAAPDGRSDQILVGGKAGIQGASVAALAADGHWNPSGTYTILKADGGITGRFDGISANFAFLDPTLSYTADSALLAFMRNDVRFSSVAASGNQRASAAAVEALGRSVLYDRVVQLDAATARAAFDQLSGEVHASVKSAALEDSRLVREVALDRARRGPGGAGLAQAAPTGEAGNGGVWTRTYGARSRADGDGNAARADRSTGGLLVGAERSVGDAGRVGGFGGLGQTSLDLREHRGSASGQAWHLGAYGGAQWGAAGWRGGAAYSRQSLDTRRDLAFPGSRDALSASYSLRTLQAFGELGWRIDAGAATAVEPFASLAHVDIHGGDFRERGLGTGAELAGRGHGMRATFATVGMRTTTRINVGGVWATLRASAGWRKVVGGDAVPTADLALGGTSRFMSAGVAVAREAFVLDAGLDLNLRHDLSLGASFSGQAGGGSRMQAFQIGLLWKF